MGGNHRVQRGMASYLAVGLDDNTHEIIMHRRVGLEAQHVMVMILMIFLGLGLVLGHLLGVMIQ